IDFYSYKTKENCYYLDKTPRYYHIIDDLYELFPQAKFIFLVRNPLSVFASILDYNFKGNYVKFLSSKDRVEDLFSAPMEIKKAIEKHENNILLKYEDLIENPEQELLKVFNYLELDLPENVGSYKVENNFINSLAVDTKSLKQHSKPSISYLDSWKNSINSTQKKKLAIDYIEALSKKHTDYFGYDLKGIAISLKTFKPEKKTIFNLDLNSLIKQEEHLSFVRLLKKRFILKLQ
ncbi:MAG: sulfotransferase, partial [Ignavibacteriae bacterium]|nr:sulfotransferase [Ignavibacteriota bacterium]